MGGPDTSMMRPTLLAMHTDLKPHNVLITEGGRAKLSDMGLSKTLVAEQSSFESHGAGGSSGWQVRGRTRDALQPSSPQQRSSLLIPS